MATRLPTRVKLFRVDPTYGTRELWEGQVIKNTYGVPRQLRLQAGPEGGKLKEKVETLGDPQRALERLAKLTALRVKQGFLFQGSKALSSRRKTAPSQVRSSKPQAALTFANGRQLHPAGYRPPKRGSLPVITAADLDRSERRQLSALPRHGWGLRQPLTPEQILGNRFASDPTTAEAGVQLHAAPVECWDVMEGSKLRYRLWVYGVDCGTLFEGVTDERVSGISQFYLNLGDADLAGRLGAAHPAVVKRDPRSELSRMRLSSSE